MKLCFVCNEYPPMPHYGIGVFYQSLAEALAKLGVDVWVTGYGRKSHPFVQNGVHVHWLTMPSPLYRSIKIGGFSYSIAGLLRRYHLSLYLNRLVKRQDIQLVESYDFSGPLATKPPCQFVVRLEGAVTVYRYCEGQPHNINPMDRYFEIKQLQAAERLIACSRHIGEATNRALGLNLKFEVIYNAVDAVQFQPQPGLAESNLILYVGNVMWRKGIFDLIKAMPLILEHHPSANLKIAGGIGGAHQNQFNTALAEIPEQARERIEILGQVSHDQLPELYNRASVFVFPSRVEAFGLTCVEAMACGRPVVATQLASGPELIVDGVSGLLADPTNPLDLAEKISSLLGNIELAQRLGNNARQRVLEKFDLRDIGPRNLAFYQSFL